MATHYFTASSVDGFIADPDNSLSWLLTQDIDRSGPMNYDAFIANIGAIAMGATTYQWVFDNNYGGENPEPWPYPMPAWVFTHHDLPAIEGDIRFTQAAVAEVHAEMTEAAQSKDIWIVGGGDLVGQFADEGLLDEVWVQYAPVTLGAGAPLLPRRLELELAELDRNRVFVCARYRVVGAG